MVFDIRKACPVCGEVRAELLYECPYDAPPVSEYLARQYRPAAGSPYLDGQTFSLHQCGECGLVYQRAVPAGPLLRDLYDLWIPKSERERCAALNTLEQYRYWMGEVEFLIRHMGMKPADLRILDYGSGWGEWANIARAFGCAIFGCEISEERVTYARSIGISMLGWDEIPEHKFHVINTEQVVEHLVEPRETLEHLARALLPGGLLKVSVPDGRGIVRQLKRDGGSIFRSPERLMPIAPLEHLNCFDHHCLVALGRKVGLVPVRPPLHQLYNASSAWLVPRQAAKNLVRPLYRHWFPRSTYVFFTHA